MARKVSDQIWCVVQYEDGGEPGQFSVSKYDLRSGDHVLRIIARERQQKGELRPGEIAAVKRVRV
jgi:hypothetical protein